MSDWQEIVGVVERVQREVEDLAIRGLRVVGPQHLASLEGLGGEFARINAGYLADQIGGLVQAISEDDASAAAKLMQVQTTLRLFERILTSEAVTPALDELARVREEKT